MLTLLLAGTVGAVGSLLSYERHTGRITLSVVLALGAALLTLSLTHALSWGEALLFGGAAAWAISDATTKYIRYRLTIPLVVIGTIAGVLSNGPFITAGGIALGAVLYGLYAFSEGRWLGGGDIMAVACVGAVFGALGGGLAYAVASVLSTLGWGVLWAVGAVPENPSDRHLPLGPYLAIGVLVTALLPVHQISAQIGLR